MNLKLVTLGDRLGSNSYAGHCWDCGLWLSRNDDVLPLGYGDYACRQCAKIRAMRLDTEFKQHIEASNQKQRGKNESTNNNT